MIIKLGLAELYQDVSLVDIYGYRCYSIPMLRKPAVSGQFYPNNAKAIEELISRFCPQAVNKISAKGIILPHAGYVYSGKVAAVAVSQVVPKQRLILLGPNHSGLGKQFSLWAKGKWKIPSAEISIDSELSGKILEKGNLVVDDQLAHQHEHSLEVQLPILQHFFGQFSFVPIACKQADLKTYRKVSEQIIAGVKELKEEVLFVASTDLTHYEPDSRARAKDRKVIEAIVNLDEETLISEVENNQITMCGLAPVAILLCCLKEIGARKAQVSLYQTSGDVSGDYSSVVGYVGVIIK